MWLSKNYKKEPEIWLIFYRKETGKARISYDDSVLEALCFGWIDSIVKKVDDESFAQRFSPRKSTSELSQMNKERIRQLIKERKMTKAGLAALAHVYDPQKDNDETFVIPSEISRALKKEKNAWENFQKMSSSYQRIRIAYIESRKRHRPEMYKKALDYLVRMTAQNKRIGIVRERRK